MTWIRKKFDFNKESIEGRDVIHDGKRVALILDLTVCNHALRSYFVNDVLSNAEATDMCWKLLTDAVVGAVSNKVRSLPKAKVTTHCFGNLGAHDHLVRGYFVPLGTTTDGARVYGLVAALRTKDHQPQVLRMLGNFNRHVPK